MGEELASIIESREDLSLAFVSSFSHEGKEYKEVFSKTNSKLVLQPIDKMPANLDYVFFATKHDYSMDYVPEILKKGVKVIDLSADFRLSNGKLWQKLMTASIGQMIFCLRLFMAYLNIQQKK